MGRDVTDNEWPSARCNELMATNKARFLQEVPEVGGFKVGSCSLIKEFMRQRIEHLRRIPMREQVSVENSSSVLARKRVCLWISSASLVEAKVSPNMKC